MKRPGWGTAIGVLMIIFGGCTVKDSLEAIYMPEMLENSREMIESSLQEEGIPQDSIDSIIRTLDSLQVMNESGDSLNLETDIGDLSQSNSIEKFVLSNISDVFNMSEHTKTWMVRFGYIGVFIALIYALAGVFMLIMKPYSIHLAYGALVLSVVFVIIRALILGSEGGELLTISTYIKSGVSAVIDVVLILVIFSSDKFEYEQLSENQAKIT